MIKLSTYSAKGRKTGQTPLPKALEEKPNDSLLAQAIHVYRHKKHKGLAKVQTRSEVTLTKAKIYKQKGTGRARHGAKSAPLFVGGGQAHGPKGLKRPRVLPKKIRQKALAIALSTKAKAGEVVVIKGVSELKKTKVAAQLIEKVLPKKGSRATLVLAKENKTAGRVFLNIKNLTTISVTSLNAYDVYFGGLIILDKEAL